MAYSFPEEVLEHVFSFLSSDKDRNAVSLVCKSWYEIERWCRRRIFVGNCYAVSPGIVIRRFPEVRAVEMKGKPHFADFNLVPEGWGGYVYPWIAAMSAAYPLLEEIKLKRMVVTDECLELISKSFKNFKVLVLSSCEGFTTDGLASIAANCRHLRELDLRESEVEDLSGHWLSHFPDNCTSLVSLNMSCLGSEVSFSALERLVARSPNLRTLRLNRAVPLEKLANLIRRAPQLVELGTGAYSAEIRSDILLNLTEAFSACKQLRGLSGFWDVVPAYLPAMYSVCSGITSLNLSYATIQSSDLVKLVTQCRNLQRLWVLDYIEDSGLEALASSCKDLQELRSSLPILSSRTKRVSNRTRARLCLRRLPQTPIRSLFLPPDVKLCIGFHRKEPDCPFGDKALLANAAKLETMRSLWMSSCSVSYGACKLLGQKMPRLNVRSYRRAGPPDSRPENCPVERLYVYRTVAGRRIDMPGFVWTMDDEDSGLRFS
ncbi:hypothetical protein DH2020_001629 [Rehmannia glutinosa]|uniref:F-box domain-containing protein n=1 Tax=Rehmannia glutinosa TaxID=99300 RepID=A0ABR0Y0R2_REHGL